ncbi:flagellar basal-body rod protein FlgB [[Eubacterium] yurii subsp. margaretiae ATCC 43715]|nr:flagellar basal-body rod protein FlgB [[Eubacterium] yurii subsp. margaretiae ATCC 43715]
MKINNDYLGTMKTALDAYSMRNESISSNLANVNTPNYKRKYVRFEEYLTASYDKQNLKGATTNIRHIEIPSSTSKAPFLATDNSVSTREDGNNVNLDTEEVDSVKNYINYSMVADQISNYFKSVITGITGGRK